MGIEAYLRRKCPFLLLKFVHSSLTYVQNNTHISDLNRLQVDIIFLLCKLEKIFSSAFFNVMVHLVIDLSYEIKVADLVSYNWMYSIERNLRTLKQFVWNKARLEGSIAKLA